ncbi:hypothetical protein QR680_000975 [Steinernema hermaphroditum]|uniref:AP-3 complex subunit delta n=1 Tax=Steinernema hermaphroditum TaxID=289476 RepID=A0AA39LF86_9BILA|nr:hypothetical protein QR680_000975 [Steinernema hermaphroditum]
MSFALPSGGNRITYMTNGSCLSESDDFAAAFNGSSSTSSKWASRLSSFQKFEAMALRKVRSNLDRLFDKSLTDLIRGIRNNKDNEAKYIAACIEEIKMELRQDSTFVKANAVEKLAYLQMMGYDISWASFNIIEVMASTKYCEKRIGYLAAAQSFHDETDVLMLTTNMIRKDLHSPNMYDVGVALGGLSCFVTTDLARDLANDVVNLLTSSRPYVRKRAVLLLYKIFLKYPESLRPTFQRLKDKLEDADPGVQSAAVNVICELARKNPKNYLSLAPMFFKLMTTSSNNWMLIKIIKLFGALVPLEPRLGKKLLEPLTNLINNTSAMSLLYECINTVIAVLISVSSGGPGDHTPSIQLCVQKLGVLIEDSDQNLKYLGLLAMGRILKTHPKAVQAHKDIVLRCLDDKDESIRLRSLDLLYGMVSKKNIMEIVKKLMEHVDAAEGSNYRDELLARIISICSYNNYQYITNFEWYISVLVELTKVEGTKHGTMIAEQIQDVTVRVQSIRHFSVSQMALLVENAHLLLAGSSQHRSNISEVLLAAVWICGEYSEHVRDIHSVLESMLKTKTSVMPGHILSVCVQNIAKLYSVMLQKYEKDEDWDSVESLDNLMLSKLPEFEYVDHLEAQERACTLVAMIRLIEKGHSNKECFGEVVGSLFDGELNPVAPKAQRKVPVPTGLDLDAWICDPISESESEEEDIHEMENVRPEFQGFGGGWTKYSDEEDEEEVVEEHEERAESVEVPVEHKKRHRKHRESAELERRRAQRQMEIENNPYYVKGEAKQAVPSKRPTKFSQKDSLECSEAPSDLQSPLEIPGVVGLNRYMEQQESTLSWKKAKEEKKSKKGKKGKKGRKNVVVVSSSEDDDLPIVHQVNRDDGEMPENAKSTDDEGDSDKKDEEEDYRALDIDLDEPLRDEERMHGPQPYAQPRVMMKQSDSFQATNGYHGEPDVFIESSPVKTRRKKEKTGKKEKKKKRSGSLKVAPPSDVVEGDVDEWLNSASATEAAARALAHGTKKKSKDGKKKKRKVVNEEENGGIDKGVYEEASGICTPSNPNLATAGDSSNGNSTPSKQQTGTFARKKSHLSSFKPLAQNNTLRMKYEVRSSQAENSAHVAISIVVENLSGGLVKQMEMNVLDSLNARLLGGSTIPVPFQLPATVSNQLDLSFKVNAFNVPQKLRGSITYFAEKEGGSFTESKIDFQLRLMAVDFLEPSSIGNDSYSLLLQSGDVDSKSSMQLPCNLPWSEALHRLCFFGHLSVVEEIKNTASLFARTVRQDPVCILLKLKDGRLQIDGRCGDQQLIYLIIDELREIASATL